MSKRPSSLYWLGPDATVRAGDRLVMAVEHGETPAENQAIAETLVQTLNRNAVLLKTKLETATMSLSLVIDNWSVIEAERS